MASRAGPYFLGCFILPGLESLTPATASSPFCRVTEGFPACFESSHPPTRGTGSMPAWGSASPVSVGA